MKKLITLFAGVALVSVSVSAQTIVFSEDFDGVGGSTAGGVGTYAFPAGWTLFDIDAQTPATNVNYVNEAWERREDFANNVADSCAYSTSWYTPAGTADDWMWTPAIANLPANCMLMWNAVTLDPAYPDGYEVRIMTTAPTTGNIMSSTILTTVAPENTTWTARTANLSAYAGQTVYIGFRNNSTDEFLLLIDDVVVGALNNYDASVTATDSTSEYTMIPMSNSPSVHLGATVTNAGTMSVTNVVVTANVYNAANALVYTANASPISTLATATSNHVTMTSFNPGAPGPYRVSYSVAINETDAVTSNNTMAGLDTMIVSDTVFARDRGAMVGALGIGAGNGGYLGQEFTLTQSSNLTSISGFIARPYSSYNVQYAVFPDSAGQPTMNPIASTAIVTLTQGTASWLTLPLASPLTLPAGKFYVCVVEIDSTAQLAQAGGEWTTGKTWVWWPSTPLGGWGHNEDFGAGFAKIYMLRANFGQFVGVNEPATANTVNVEAYPNPTNGAFNVSYNFEQPTDATINIYNALGAVVQTVALSGVTQGVAPITLDCKDAGAYMVEVVTPQGTSQTQVIVQ